MLMMKMLVVVFGVTLLFEKRLRRIISAIALKRRDLNGNPRKFAGTFTTPLLRIRQMHLVVSPSRNASKMQTLCRSALGIVEVQSTHGIVSWSVLGIAITSTSQRRQRHPYQSLLLHLFLHHLFLLLATCGTPQCISTICMEI